MEVWGIVLQAKLWNGGTLMEGQLNLSIQKTLKNIVLYFLLFLQRLTKGNNINNNKMDCQPYRKRRPAVKRAAFLRDRERRKTYKETGPK